MNLVKEQSKNLLKGNPNWKKGVSGNPKGRTPNDCSFTIAAREYLTANPEVRENIVKRVAKDAENGKEWATKLFWGYMDGAIPQNLNLAGADGEKLIDENIIVKAILSALGK